WRAALPDFAQQARTGQGAERVGGASGTSSSSMTRRARFQLDNQIMDGSSAQIGHRMCDRWIPVCLTSFALADSLPAVIECYLCFERSQRIYDIIRVGVHRDRLAD